MIILEYYNTFNDKKLKKKIRLGIRDILMTFILKSVYDYKITDFSIDIIDVNKRIEITIFGYGKPSLDNDIKKHDALVKMIFVKKFVIWSYDYKKSLTYRKIQNRYTDIGDDNIVEIQKNVLDFLNKK